MQPEIKIKFLNMKTGKAILTIAWLFIILFAYAAFIKLFEFNSFVRQLKHSPFIGAFASIVAVLLPAIELIIVPLLVFPKTRIFGLYGSLILLMAFTCYISFLICVAPSLPCSCGGIIGKLSWQQHLLFNVILCLIALAGILLYDKSVRTTKRNNLTNCEST
jgi:hypothetical protein